jgi:apolipoprotein N-acyltransferase
MVRGFVPAIGTWAFVGYALWDQPWLIQPLSVLGIYGLDLLIMLCNYALTQSIFPLLDRREHRDEVLAIQASATRR